MISPMRFGRTGGACKCRRRPMVRFRVSASPRGPIPRAWRATFELPAAKRPPMEINLWTGLIDPSIPKRRQRISASRFPSSLNYSISSRVDCQFQILTCVYCGAKISCCARDYHTSTIILNSNHKIIFFL